MHFYRQIAQIPLDFLFDISFNNLHLTDFVVTQFYN